MTRPYVRTRLDQAGVQTQAMSSEQFKTYIAEEISKWEVIVKQSGVKLD
jgi:tripartite-type tricarboxylate transporter receptor subunit TctC